MKTSIGIAALAIAALVAGAGMAQAQQKEWKEVRIGTEGAYPPWNNLNTKGELEGFEIDYGNALCEKMKVKCTFVAQDWDGIIPALLAGKYDVIMAGMNATDERAKKVDFTTVYSRTPISFIAGKAVTGTDISPAALKGKAIGAQGSTIHANYLEKYYKDSQHQALPDAGRGEPRPEERPARLHPRRQARPDRLRRRTGQGLLQVRRRHQA